MIKRLVKHGNSRALIIDRAVLDILHIDDDTELMVAMEGKSLVITPSRPENEEEAERRQEFEETKKRVLKKYESVFRRLAE